MIFPALMENNIFFNHKSVDQGKTSIKVKKSKLRNMLTSKVNFTQYEILHFNSFTPNVTFIYPLKTPEGFLITVGFSDVSRGYINVMFVKMG